ncbi:MAG: hypothetical protein RLZZ165_2022 [Bacteroidota bacterium]
MDGRRILSDPTGILKRHLLHWAALQPYCLWLDSCGSSTDRYGDHEFMVGVALQWDAGLAHHLDELGRTMAHGPRGWHFGFLGYDLKDELEPRLRADLQSSVAFPGMGIFRADVVVTQKRNSSEVIFEAGYSERIHHAILDTPSPKAGVHGFTGFTSNFTEAEYCHTVERIRQHILEGEVYEVNLSQCFTAAIRIDAPVTLWERLVQSSPVPFSGYCKWGDLHVLCASPERFLRLHGHRLTTQPIKGTSPRGATPEADAQSAHRLRTSPKEQAENVMIVDLSRNDLHRSCETGSVEVPQLFELQTFPQVHHLVSTVTGRKRKDLSAVDVLRNTFPPGSMTGAPKIRACELIAQYERLSRGVYSGGLGYFAPDGGFDFNVVIRSLVYDASAHRISYHVGGAITWDSVPEEEYAETILKAKAIEGLF